MIRSLLGELGRSRSRGGRGTWRESRGPTLGARLASGANFLIGRNGSRARTSATGGPIATVSGSFRRGDRALSNAGKTARNGAISSLDSLSLFLLCVARFLPQLTEPEVACFTSLKKLDGQMATDGEDATRRVTSRHVVVC